MSLKKINEVQEDLLKDKPLLVLKDGDSVEVIPITPVREEKSRFNAQVDQYRMVMYVPSNKSLRQFILSKQRFMRLINLTGDWSVTEKSALIRISKTGEGISSVYNFALVKTDNDIRMLHRQAITDLAMLEDTEGWEDFVNWAKSQAIEDRKSKAIGKAFDKASKEKEEKKVE